jgi:hypothetical protein
VRPAIHPPQRDGHHEHPGRGEDHPTTLWVPEMSRTAADLHLSPTLPRHDPLVTLKLIYQLSAKLLSWMVLHTRSDTAAKEIESLVLRHQLAMLQRRRR